MTSQSESEVVAKGRSGPEISVIIPAHDEEENVKSASQVMSAALDRLGVPWELILVDDGSADRTGELAGELSRQDPRVRVRAHPVNMGRGHALRTGFAAARGTYVFTIDCDLSYSPDHIVRMYHALRSETRPDIVVASPYMKGGRTEGVPISRLLPSRLGNKLLSYAMGGIVKTVTGITRGYRRSALLGLDLTSDGKEIHLEIISKALAMGYRIEEIPAVLRGRSKGRSKVKFRVTTISHLYFTFYERPLIFFGVLGLALILLGLIGGGAIVIMWRSGTLNPNRPLMTLVVLLILGGVQVLSLGFVGSQIASMRRDIFRIQSQSKNLERSAGDKDDGEQ